MTAQGVFAVLAGELDMTCSGRLEAVGRLLHGEGVAIGCALP